MKYDLFGFERHCIYLRRRLYSSERISQGCLTIKIEHSPLFECVFSSRPLSHRLVFCST
jgi:hypothetical protein